MNRAGHPKIQEILYWLGRRLCISSPLSGIFVAPTLVDEADKSGGGTGPGSCSGNCQKFASGVHNIRKNYTRRVFHIPLKRWNWWDI
jgi:hypothetical protein